MDIIASFITNLQAAKAMQPSQRAFHDPAVNSQAAAVFSSSFGQHRMNPHVTQATPMRFRVVSPVAIDRIKTVTRTSPLPGHRGYIINHGQQLGDVVTVGPSQFDDQGEALGIGEKVMFRPQFPSIRGIRARFRPPKSARTEAESTTAREKSIWSAWRSLFKSIRCILSQIPCFFQACRRRQQVIPLPQPISWGRYSQGIPVRSTKIIPVNALRLLTSGRPPLGREGCLGSKGSMISHNSSGRSGLAIALSSLTILDILYSLFSIHRLYYYQKLRFC
jgi:hypothetical protein